MALTEFTAKSVFRYDPKVSREDLSARKAKPKSIAGPDKIKAAYDLGYKYGADIKSRGVNLDGRYKDEGRSQAFIEGYREGMKIRYNQSV